MEATRSKGAVHAGPAAREQFYDARGYGQPQDGDLVLAPVEAAHLLFRGDLSAVDGQGFEAFLASAAVSPVAFQVYKDLRDRGFYLSPVGDGPGRVDAAAVGVAAADGAAGTRAADATVDFVVYPRGKGPWDDEVAFRVRAASERADVAAAGLVALADVAGDTDADDGSGAADDGQDPGALLAVVDEESELTYLGVSRHRPTGETDHDLPRGVDATLLEDRVLVSSPPAALHDLAFYGQRLDRDAGALQVSLVEAAFLAARGVLEFEGGAAAVCERGRTVEGDRFDRRLAVYEALRRAGVVPKTGFKFGADFRTYAAVEDVENLGHSELLVRVLASEHVFEPRDLALDVRLAHGVRKEMVYALVGPGEDEGDDATAEADVPGGRAGRGGGPDGGRRIDWLGIRRVTP